MNGKKYFTKKIILTALIFTMLLFFYFLLFINGISYKSSISENPTANITLIVGDIVNTVDLKLLSISTSTPTLNPEIYNNETIVNGKYIQISETGGVGLRIRNNPGTNSNINFIAQEDEVFLIIGGPIEQDGFVWWQLSAPYDQSRQGWAVENYLKIIHQ